MAAKKKAKGAPPFSRRSLLSALRYLQREQVRARVWWSFDDGPMFADAGTIKESLERQKQFLQSDRPSKAPQDLQYLIVTTFAEYMLEYMGQDTNVLVARERARGKLVKVLPDLVKERTGKSISIATARRWVAEVKGPKRAIPKSTRRILRRKPKR